MRNIISVLTVSMLAVTSFLFTPAILLAHCDGLDGPVVEAARKALAARNSAFVLIWVQEKDEWEIRAAFEQTLAVRTLSQKAAELADRYFFETVVRLHRTGEGASYTGLKPAGRDLGPAIPAADRALDEGRLDALVKLLATATEKGVREHFSQAVAARSFDPQDVAEGRHYVKAYVEFIHYVERLYDAVATPAHGHFPELETTTRR